MKFKCGAAMTIKHRMRPPNRLRVEEKATRSKTCQYKRRSIFCIALCTNHFFAFKNDEDDDDDDDDDDVGEEFVGEGGDET